MLIATCEVLNMQLIISNLRSYMREQEKKKWFKMLGQQIK